MLKAPQNSGVTDARYLKTGDLFRAPADIFHPVCPLTNPLVPRTWRILAFGGGRNRQYAFVERLSDGYVKTMRLRALVQYV